MISSLSLSLSFPIGIVAWVDSDFEQNNHWIMIILLEEDRGKKLSKTNGKKLFRVSEQQALVVYLLKLLLLLLLVKKAVKAISLFLSFCVFKPTILGSFYYFFCLFCESSTNE